MITRDQARHCKQTIKGHAPKQADIARFQYVHNSEVVIN